MPLTDCSIPAVAPSARVVAPYAHTLWHAARAQGLDDTLLIATLGRAAIGDDDVSVVAYLGLLQAARAQAGPLFGWRLGQAVKPTSYGVNGILLLACATLGDALQQVLRFESLVHDLGRSSVSGRRDRVVCAWRNDCAAHAAAGALAESVFSGIQTCAQWLVGRPLGDFELEFTHATDAATAARIAQWSGARVRWSVAENRAIFPASLLAWPIPQANKALLPLLQQHAEALLQARYPQDVGYLLGFQATPAFHHAFKGWQGQGPGQYRASALQKI